jgi:molecular chaperone Hsp33
LSTPSKWTKYLANQSNIRVVVVEALSLVQELVDRHQLTDICGQGLGEAAIGILLIASAQKDGNRVNLSVRGDGRIKRAIVDAYPEGHVRGYIIENTSEPNMTKDIGPWGRGILSVLYTKYEESDQPYIGSVPLLTGFLAQDLSHFWLQSEQLPSVVGLDVKVKAGRVLKADGLLVQTVGQSNDDEKQIIVSLADKIQKITETNSADNRAVDQLTQLFPNLSFMIMEDSYLTFKCNCSEERVERAIMLTGEKELQDMINKNEEVKAHCEFCNTEYKISVERLRILRKVSN